jgi:hypothetical protein
LHSFAGFIAMCICDAGLEDTDELRVTSKRDLAERWYNWSSDPSLDMRDRNVELLGDIIILIVDHFATPSEARFQVEEAKYNVFVRIHQLLQIAQKVHSKCEGDCAVTATGRKGIGFYCQVHPELQNLGGLGVLWQYLLLVGALDKEDRSNVIWHREFTYEFSKAMRLPYCVLQQQRQ